MLNWWCFFRFYETLNLLINIQKLLFVLLWSLLHSKNKFQCGLYNQRLWITKVYFNVFINLYHFQTFILLFISLSIYFLFVNLKTPGRNQITAKPTTITALIPKQALVPATTEKERWARVLKKKMILQMKENVKIKIIAPMIDQRSL